MSKFVGVSTLVVGDVINYGGRDRTVIGHGTQPVRGNRGLFWDLTVKSEDGRVDHVFPSNTAMVRKFN